MFKLRTTALLIPLVLLALSLPALADDLFSRGLVQDSWTTTTTSGSRANYSGERTLMDELHARQSYSRFVDAVHAAQLNGQFDGSEQGTWTVFVPTNAAFDSLPDGVVDALLLPENRPLLEQTINYHIIRGNSATASFMNREEVMLTNGDAWPFACDDDSYTLGNARVVDTDVLASNGRIHVIDTVLLPMDVIDALEDDGYRLAAWYPADGHGVVMGSSRHRGADGWDKDSYNGRPSAMDRAGGDAKYEKEYRGDKFYGYDKDRNKDRDDDNDDNYQRSSGGCG